MAKKWRCTVCGYIHEGPEAPDQCPMCKVGKEKFVELVEAEGDLDFVTVHKIGDGSSIAHKARLSSVLRPAVYYLFDLRHVGRILHQHPLAAVQQVEGRNGVEVVQALFADDAPLVVGIDPRRRNVVAVVAPLRKVFTNATLSRFRFYRAFCPDMSGPNGNTFVFFVRAGLR
jgi:rubredoxin